MCKSVWIAVKPAELRSGTYEPERIAEIIASFQTGPGESWRIAESVEPGQPIRIPEDPGKTSRVLDRPVRIHEDRGETSRTQDRSGRIQEGQVTMPDSQALIKAAGKNLIVLTKQSR